MLTILAFIVVLGVLIFVHELGHFMTAKAVDIEVPRFSIGFGPKIIGFRRGETEYVISALPLGGYVKMAGMEEMEQIEGGPATVNDTIGAESKEELEAMAARPHRPRDFESKSLPARMLVISAGVIMNFLFAFLTFSLIAGIWGVPSDPGPVIARVAADRLAPEAAALATIAPGARVTGLNDVSVRTWRDLQLALTRVRPGEATIRLEGTGPVTFTVPRDDEQRAALIGAIEPAIEVVLGAVDAGGPAATAGLRPGDRILAAGGETLVTWPQFVQVIRANLGQTVPLVVQRNGREVALEVTPEERALESGETVGSIGVAVQEQRQRAGPIGAVARGAQQTWDMSALTVDFLIGMFTGRHSARNVGGPLMIGEMSGRFARLGLEPFLSFMAILSINLAILNLLPIPVLDGGHLVFLGIEAVRGRALSIQTRMRLTQVGFVLIIMLMVWALGNDILRFVGI